MSTWSAQSRGRGVGGSMGYDGLWVAAAESGLESVDHRGRWVSQSVVQGRRNGIGKGSTLSSSGGQTLCVSSKRYYLHPDSYRGP